MMKDFGKKDRKVTLDGEAYFEVAHNKEIPFLCADRKHKGASHRNKIRCMLL